MAPCEGENIGQLGREASGSRGVEWREGREDGECLCMLQRQLKHESCKIGNKRMGMKEEIKTYTPTRHLPVDSDILSTGRDEVGVPRRA